jgi:hypothetical protein
MKDVLKSVWHLFLIGMLYVGFAMAWAIDSTIEWFKK